MKHDSDLSGKPTGAPRPSESKGGRGLLFALTLALTAALFARGSQAADGELLTRVFDIRQMTVPVSERPGPPALGVAAVMAHDFDHRPFEGEFEGFDSDSRDMTEDEIMATVEEMLPDATTGQGASLRLVNGRLHATLAPRDMLKLESLVESLCASWNTLVGVKAVMIEPGPETDSPAGEPDDKAIESLVAAARAAGRWTETLTLCGTNNRRFHAVKSRQSLYLSEYDVEVASGASIHDPVMGSIETGVMIDVRPNLSSDGSSCSILLRASCSFATSGAEFSNFQTPAGMIQKPDLTNFNFQTALTVRTGKWVLLSSGGPSERGVKGIRLYIKIERPAAVK